LQFINVKWRIVNDKNRHPPCIVGNTDVNPRLVQRQRPWESAFANNVIAKKTVVIKYENGLHINIFTPFVWITIVYAVPHNLVLKIRPPATNALFFVIRLEIHA
jgi:hypothetical protein